MDQDLRALEHRFDVAPDPLLAQKLVHEHARRGTHPRAAVLRLTPRWRPLVEFVSRWFERPLDDEDGVTSAELIAAQERFGARLPAALAEWHLLLGRRLQQVQDWPGKVEKIGITRRPEDGDNVLVWQENQCGWQILVPTGGAEDDPPVTVWNASESCPPARLVETLYSMLESETLVGAWCGAHRGPLGDLGPGVLGGKVPLGSESIAMFPLLAGPGCPSFSFDPEMHVRGDEVTVLRYDMVGVEWMTATPAAFGRLAAILDLENAEFVLVVRFEGLPPELQGHPNDGDPFGVLAGLGLRTQMMRYGGQDFEAHVPTPDPQTTLERIRAALPFGVADRHLVAGYRSEKIAQHRSLWPPGERRFRPL